MYRLRGMSMDQALGMITNPIVISRPRPDLRRPAPGGGILNTLPAMQKSVTPYPAASYAPLGGDSDTPWYKNPIVIVGGLVAAYFAYKLIKGGKSPLGE